jgi:alanine racemase
VPAGTPVSYGGTYVTDRQTRIATVPVGYGDGYPRSLSGKGYVLIHGQKAPVLGRVCMDQFMVDITHLPDANEGDEVVLIGQDGGQEITAEELGDLSGRFNYELTCDLNHRVPRIYVREDD